MLHLRIVARPRQGSCILGLLNAPAGRGDEAVSIINDYHGLSLLVNSLDYLHTVEGTSFTQYPAVKSVSTVVEHDVPVLLVDDKYEVQVPVGNPDFRLTCETVHRADKTGSTLYYRFVPDRYLWYSSQSGSDYEDLLKVGAEIYESIRFEDFDGNPVDVVFDVSLPTVTKDSVSLPDHVYYFEIYAVSVPSKPTVIIYEAYDIATGEQKEVKIPFNLEYIFDNTRVRNIISIESFGMKEYIVPFDDSTMTYGADDKITIVNRNTSPFYEYVETLVENSTHTFVWCPKYCIEKSDSLIKDIVNSTTLTYYNGVSVANNIMSFDGSNDYAQTGNFDLTTQAVYYAALIKVDAWSGHRYIITFGDTGTTASLRHSLLRAWYDGSNEYEFIIGSSDGTNWNYACSENVEADANSWFFVEGVVGATGGKIIYADTGTNSYSYSSGYTIQTQNVSGKPIVVGGSLYNGSIINYLDCNIGLICAAYGSADEIDELRSAVADRRLFSLIQKVFPEYIG